MIIYSPNSIPIISLTVDDESYRYKAIMGDNILHLEFSLTQHVELPVGSYVDWRGTRYELMNYAAVTIQHTRQYDYRINLEGPEAHLRRYRVHAVGDGRLQFEMIGRPSDHIAMVVTNLQEREGADYWIAGDLLEGEEKLISYNFSTAQEALGLIAEAYDTEWELTVENYNTGTETVKRKVIHLRKLDYYADDPLHLAYGADAGFSPGVGRLNYGENGQLQRVYVQGGEQNISREVYDDAHLHLPKDFAFDFDGAHFRYEIDGTTYTETDFDADKAVAMVTDEWGYSVRLSDAPTAANEGALDLSDIYPKRVGTVTDVRYVYNGQYYTYAQLSALGISGDDWLAVQVDIIDSTIGSELDYSQCLMANDQPLTVIFQTGELMGREFSATFVKAASSTRPANRFELVRTNIDGIEVPNDSFRPNAGSTQDTYIVVNCAMPDEYISDPTNFEGAEIDMLRSAAKYLYENKDPQFTFKGEVDEMFAKRNWGTTLDGETATVGAKLVVGGCISFSHPQVQPAAVTVRITALKEFVNKPYAPELTLSNETVSGGFGVSLAQMRGETESVKRRATSVERFTKRTFRDALETMEMLEAAMLEGFTERINPIAVQTMQLLVGSEGLQFRFVDAIGTASHTPVEQDHTFTYNSATKIFSTTAGVIQHMTLGIDTLSNTHAATEYTYWTMPAFTSQYLGDSLATEKYYFYAKCPATSGSAGTWQLTTTAHDFLESGYYWLLTGILNSEQDGVRSFVTLYGFTEILPGRITTDRIVSANGYNYFDLAANKFHLGDAADNNFLDWNNLASGTLRIKGAIVQSPSGDTSAVTCYRGNYNSSSVYYPGDAVTYGGATYRCIAQTTAGTNPTNTAYWAVLAAGGSSGTPGTDGNGVGFAYYKIAFSDTAPSSGPSSAPTTSSNNYLTWSITPPTMSTQGDITYVSQRTYDGATSTWSAWSTPSVFARYSPDGATGSSGPSVVYRGEWNATTTYVGNSTVLDIVHHDGMYYIAKATAGSFSGVEPGGMVLHWDDYWTKFGSVFESVATSVLYAQSGYIENAIVRLLQTSDSGVRVEVLDNDVKIYDADERIVARLTGDELPDWGTVSKTQAISQNQVLNGSLTLDEGEMTTMQAIYGQKVSIGTLSLDAPSTVTIPAITFPITEFTGYTGSTTHDATVTLRLYDGTRLLSTSSYDAALSGTTQTATGTSTAVSVGMRAGTHTIYAQMTITFGSAGAGTYTAKGRVNAFTLTALSSLRCTTVASNGFRAAFDASNYFEAVQDSNNAISFAIRSGNYGLKVSATGGLQKMTDGSTWGSL